MQRISVPAAFHFPQYLSGPPLFHRPCSGAIIKPTSIFPIGKELINGRIRQPDDELLPARFFLSIKKDIKSRKNILLYRELPRNAPNFHQERPQAVVWNRKVPTEEEGNRVERRLRSRRAFRSTQERRVRTRKGRGEAAQTKFFRRRSKQLRRRPQTLWGGEGTCSGGHGSFRWEKETIRGPIRTFNLPKQWSGLPGYDII